MSVEADVWAFEGQLLVAHKRDSLSPSHTLQSLYLDPLYRMLADKNNDTEDSGSPRGVYDIDPLQELVLLIDVEACPQRAWPLLNAALQPLRERKWLTISENVTLTQGPITVLVTGSLPAYLVESDIETASQGVFLDAPLLEIDSGKYNSPNAYWASTSHRRLLDSAYRNHRHRVSREKVETYMKHAIDLAHARSLKARCWGLPRAGFGRPDDTWHNLMALGMDVVNVDNLAAFREAWVRLRPTARKK